MKIFQFGTACLAAVTMLLLCSTARAGIIINLTDNGNNTTTATITGSVDLALLAAPFATNQNQPTRYLFPSGGWFSNATGPVNSYAVTFSSQTGYGTGGHANMTGSNIGGQTFGFYIVGTIQLPNNYVSNSALNGAMTLQGTPTSLGIAPYTQYSFSQGGLAAQTITLSAVPEPTSLCLVGIGLVGCVVRRSRRKLA